MHNCHGCKFLVSICMHLEIALDKCVTFLAKLPMIYFIENTEIFLNAWKYDKIYME